jgi:hypothetical protein
MSPRSSYMAEYYRKSPILQCADCGSNYKKCYGYKHLRTSHHLKCKEFFSRMKTLND